MNCKSVLNLLEEYLDGALQDDRDLELELHMKRCSGCRAELEAARMVRGILSEQETVCAPADFTRHVLLALEQEEARKFRRRTIFATILSAAFVLCVFVVLIVYLNSLGMLTFGFSSKDAKTYSQELVEKSKSTFADIESHLPFKITSDLPYKATIALISLLFTALLLAASNLIYNYRQLRL